MYSPKIREELIPRIYRAARVNGYPMTTWVNQVLEDALSEAAAVQPQPENQKKVNESYEHTRDRTQSS
jgi:hypothetical protein